MLAVNGENLRVIEQALRGGGNKDFMALARAMHADKPVAISDICAALGVGRTTFYRYLKVPQGKAS